MPSMASRGIVMPTILDIRVRKTKKDILKRANT